MSRWKMHKLGFVNFWLYDREEFEIEDGHFLLRGQNGAGKSITTQSFIPFILDGDRRPERLDPFGSRDKKMEFYLLGDGEKDESTGYLYLEFKKPDVEQYLTIGIGLWARKGKNMDFWGFCLRDGRRIGTGEGDVDLVEHIGEQMVPLTRIKLRNLLNTPSDWVESPGDYKRLVNERVFGFRDIRQFEQLVSLLIKVRMPKLSKDSQKPSELKKILNDSLQVLTDEDLSAMVSTLERMDELHDTLEGLQNAVRNTEIIQREYNRYNRYMQGRKGRAYLDGCTDARKRQQELDRNCRELKEAEDELERQNGILEDAEIRIQRAKSQKIALGEDDLSAKQEQLSQMNESRTRQEAMVTEGSRKLEEVEQDISRQEAKLQELRQEILSAKSSLSLLLRSLEKKNQTLLLGDEHEEFVRDLQERWDADSSRLGVALKNRKELIHDILGDLRDLERRQAEHEEACQATDAAEAVRIDMEAKERDAQDLEKQERDAIIEKFLIQKAENQELLFTDEDMQDIQRRLIHYSTGADWTPIRELTDGRYRAFSEELINEKAQAAQLKKQSQDEVKKLTLQLEQLKRQPDPTPPRRALVEETRRQLTMRGIPHAALYEATDFAPDLTQEKKNLLETQMADAGLLDALIVPEEYWPAVRTLMEEYPDRFLIPGPAAADPLTALVPDGTRVSHELVEACLRGISCSDMEAQTAILPDGRYRNGLIQGWSRAEEEAGYIGAEARRANRERKLQELQASLDAANAELQNYTEQLSRLESRMKRLKEELEQLPSPRELDMALDLVRQAERDLQDAVTKLQICQERERKLEHEIGRLKESISSRNLGLPYQPDLEDFEILEDIADEYGDVLSRINEDKNKLVYSQRSYEDKEEQLAKREDDADWQRRSNRDLNHDLQIILGRIQALEEVLASPETLDRINQLKKMDEEIDAQTRRSGDARQAVGTQQQVILNRKDRIQDCQARMEEAEDRKRCLEEYFREEIRLENPDPNARDLTLEQSARNACDRVSASDWERSPEQMGESLMKNFQEHRNTLLSYHPYNELTFDTPEYPDMLRQRYRIFFREEGRELSMSSFLEILRSRITQTELVLEDKDRELFENILTETVTHKLRSRIEESQQWTRDMTELMDRIDTSMGLKFRLDWKPRKADGENELDTAKLVELLNRDQALLREEDKQKVTAHFRQKVRMARDAAMMDGQSANYGDLIRETLDYRNWYEFRLMSQRTGENWKDLTDRAFNQFSGGEKAMAMYVPLFASVSSQYKKAGEDSPLLLAMDEAFAGVDDRNIGTMFELVSSLNFDYIMNSQAIWGCYECVKSLDIAELHRMENAKVVTIIKYHWDGRKREMLEVEM